MRKMKKTAALLAIVSLVGAGALAGCNDSKGAEASTPANSPTTANTAVQTDADGKTTGAPATASTPVETDSTDKGTAPTEGDADAGKTIFEATCQGCHPNDGNDAGVGPKLVGAPNISPALIKDRITNGKGAMPPGLVTDPTELENVVAFVMSEQ